MCSWLGSLVTQTVKNLPALQETQVPFLGRARPLEKGMVTSSNTLAWRVPWIEEPGGLQSSGSQRVGPELSRSRSIFLRVPRGEVQNILLSFTGSVHLVIR